MSDFFRRYIDELLSDATFSARHPHFHVRLFPIDELAHITVGTLEGRDLRKYNKSLAALLRGDPVDRITVDIVSSVLEPVLSAGAPVLQAARDAGKTELWARVRYVSRTVERVWWNSPGVSGAGNIPELEVLITEDEDPILTEDGDELAA
jgi:hypothetical protein